MQATKRILALFDVDQTLTPARKSIQQSMIDTLIKIREKGVAVGIVSGSDLNKVREQVSEQVVLYSEFTFAENGLYALKKGELFAFKSIKDQLGEERLKEFINFCLRYIADLDIPIKR